MLDPSHVRAQIEALRVTCPEIWEDEPLLADMLEAETDLHSLLGFIVRKIRDADALMIGIDDIIADLRERHARYDRRVEGLRAMAFKLLNHAGVRKLELPEATLSIRAGQNKVVISDETMLPDDCVRIKREPNKTAIKVRLEAGDDVPGASLSNAEPVLAMRTK